MSWIQGINAWIQGINAWIDGHLALVVLVGVPLLTAGVTAFVSYKATQANIGAQDKLREHNNQLKLAEFRQSWINDMRQDLALYTARTWSEELNKGNEATKERVMAQARILMRMNPKDPDYEGLLEALQNPVAKPDENRRGLFELGQNILKREWERLKSDLNETERR